MLIKACKEKRSLSHIFLSPCPSPQLFTCPELAPYFYKLLDCLSCQPQALFIDFLVDK